MGLTWDVNFLKTLPGMLMGGQVVVSIVGGIVNIFSLGLATGLLGFLFWSTAVISGFLLLCHVCNLIQMIEAKFPIFAKVQLGYIALWTILFLIACILSFITFGVSAILGYIDIILFIIDGGLRYRAYRAVASSPAATGTAGLDPSNAAQAGAPPKY